MNRRTFILFALVGLSATYLLGRVVIHRPLSNPARCDVVNSVGLRLVYLPPGEFMMGNAEIPDASPAHRVAVDGFYIGQYEVTNAQFEQFRKRWRPVESEADNQPVTRVSWREANEFCKWLSRREGKRYRLPTEAEWEYAARGGLKGKDWPWGNQSPIERATFGSMDTTPVGKYAPNGFGLYDMAGNVEEYISDWYAERYYASSPKANPQGPTKGDFRIRRGGFNSIYLGQVWFRHPVTPEFVGNLKKWDDYDEADGAGIRVVMEIKGLPLRARDKRRP